MYLTPSDNYWAADIEGDGLPSKKIWCFCAVNIKTGEEISLTDGEEIKKWVDALLHERGKLVFHNGIGYDAPTLNRLLGTRIGPGDVIDTMLMSMFYSPSLDGGHSLDVWGQRVHLPKIHFEDFSALSDDMLRYCLGDARICRKVYLELVRRMKAQKFSEDGISLEHRTWALVKRQQEKGFYFSVEDAHVLYSRLRKIEQDIKDQLNHYFPPRLQVIATYSKPYRKDGSPTANFARHQSEYEQVIVESDGSKYHCHGYVSFNIGSPPQRIEKLLALGWQPRPDERTPTGLPKPTSRGRLVPSLEEFVKDSGKEEPRLIAQWIEVNARANMINTWIEAFNHDTHCIHGSLWLANTLRYRHSNPNTANIPAVRIGGDEKPLFGIDGVWTYEARDLWRTRDPVSRSLVGVDAKGIQLRVLAHYLNNPKFTEAVLDGDPHSYNQEIGGFRTRAIAKTFIYAFLLGAGDAKIGQIIGGSTADGKDVKSRFIGNFPGLKQLLDDLERQIKASGRIRLCDGTPILVSAPHTRLGYLLQGDESRIMKKAALLVDIENRRRKLDVIKVCDVHDEHQYDVLDKHIEEFSNSLPERFALSGQFFNYRVPIECSIKTGKTWASTH